MSYNPTIGAFLTRDPIGPAGSGNDLYAYTADDPMNATDPTGLTPKSDEASVDKPITGLRPGVFMDEWSDADRFDWLNGFWGRYGKDIEASAKKYCIPMALLASIIANERIDEGFKEQAKSITDLGESVGPAHIRAATVLREGVLTADEYRQLSGDAGVPEPVIGPGMLAYVGPQEGLSLGRQDQINATTVSMALRERLRGNTPADQAFHIDLAARLLSSYLDQLCKARQANTLTHSFYARSFDLEGIASHRDAARALEWLCCNRAKNCDVVVHMSVPSGLIAAFALMWNNGSQIMSDNNIPEGGNAANHAWNAAHFEGVFEPLMNTHGVPTTQPWR